MVPPPSDILLIIHYSLSRWAKAIPPPTCGLKPLCRSVFVVNTVVAVVSLRSFAPAVTPAVVAAATALLSTVHLLQPRRRRRSDSSTLYCSPALRPPPPPVLLLCDRRRHLVVNPLSRLCVVVSLW